MAQPRVSPPEPPRRYMSYEEFLADPSDERAEWVNGEVVPMGTVGDDHNDVTGFLIAVFRVLAKRMKSGRVFHEPFNMKLRHDLPGRCPDVSFVKAANLDRVAGNHLNGPADLVVEVISPESGSRDRGDKYFEYEAAGVTEYWIIDPRREVAEFYVLDSTGHYTPVLPEDGVYASQTLPGMRLRVDWLWSPDDDVALRELGVA